MKQSRKENPDSTGATRRNNGNESVSKKDSFIEAPKISLPKGGGALKNIDEKFQVNAANGTSAFLIPLPVSSGRNDFSPSLNLSYNSGVGNGIFGIGWGVDLPNIQRKTEKQLPTYVDSEDTFTFSGLEDLVPMLDDTLTPVKNGIAERFRPRIEGSFSRIEKINDPGGIYWKVTSKENITTVFGRGDPHRIANPDKPSEIFKWLPEFSFDDKGNWIKYEYERDDNKQNETDPFVPDHLHERNRKKGIEKFTNTYLKRIKYGNITPYKLERYKDQPLNPQLITDADKYVFELVFDYGEHGDLIKPEDENPNQLTEITVNYDAGLPWKHREDAHSDYRSGFEIRTYRLCRRVLMFHRFKELGNTPCLVKSLDFEYEISNKDAAQFTEVNYLKRITQSGYERKTGDTYIKQSLPPMDFDYQKLRWDKSVYEVSSENVVNAPAGLSSGYQWIDLYGEGISGIFTEQDRGWFYKNNLGDISKNPEGEYLHTHESHFSRAELIAPKPSFTGAATGVIQFQDLEADGNKQAVVQSPTLKGYFELNDDNEWKSFRAFEQVVNLDLRDPNIKFFDLDGDGQPEIVLSEESVFTWYVSDGKKGYKPARYTRKPFDDEYGPALVFADEKQSVFLADMSGDGLTDIVRIRNGEICYWANKGYGRFSAKINMSNAPVFDSPDLFNPAYLNLVDISGTGATDIVYLGKNKFRSWLNLSGNAWSPVQEIERFFPTEQPNQISVVDLLGNGTACIVWSSPLPAYANAPLRYIDLMGGRKPHILTKYSNNFGKETELEYQPSTFFYLKDKLEGKKWITKLPFPVQCVHKIKLRDAFNESVFTTIYDYHHGYYDHAEREFRGFGMVEQRDSENYDLWKRNGGNLENPLLFQHPVLSRTWYHTGAFLRKEVILKQFESEYFKNTFFSEYHLPDARLETGGVELSPDELSEAHRACKAMVLRQEIYLLDEDILKREIPLSAAEHNCHIRLIQPRGNNRHASFIAVESEAITYHYERDATDPRIAHNFNIKIDELGNVEKSVAAVYGRKGGVSTLPAVLKDVANQQSILDAEQQKTHLILTENRFTDDISTNVSYRLRRMCDVKTFELTGLSTAGYFDLPSVKSAVESAAFLTYEKKPSGGFEKRIIEHARTLFADGSDLNKPLVLGSLDRLGIVYETYKLAFSTAYINSAEILDGRVNDTMLADKNTGGAYRKSNDLKTAGFPVTDPDGEWWIASGTKRYGASPEDTFYLPQRYVDSFGNKTDVVYDTQYQLFIEKTSDALNNEISVVSYNYRTLQMQELKDINDNLSEIRFDALGLVVGTSTKGKETGTADPLVNSGDDFSGFKAALTAKEVQDFLDDPLANGRNLLKNATSRFVYDFHQFRKSNGKLPNVVALILKEEHTVRDANPKLQYSFEYSDGLGHAVMKKVQDEPGEAFFIDSDGTRQTRTDTDPRWTGTGRVVTNNKGKPVKQFEPYFSVTHKFENSKNLVEIGFSPLMYYDAVGRLIKTEYPDDTFSEVLFDAWHQKTFDRNDTVLGSNWYTQRIGGSLGAYEQQAAQKAAIHNQTPSTMFLDSLGREFYTLAHNRFKDKTAVVQEEFYATRIELDIENNQRKVIDGNYNTVMAYEYDMLGSRLKQTAMDSGIRRMLNDYIGKALYGWDSKNNVFRTAYDVLQRPVEYFVSQSGAPEIVYDKTEYGTDATKNENGKVLKKYDGAGLVVHSNFDFKGNIGTSGRRFTDDHKVTPDWKNVAAVALKPETYSTTTVFDALNRPVSISTPDGSVTHPVFNEANLLNEVKVNIKGAVAKTFVSNIDYDAKGQRQRIEYGNGTVTTYRYNPKTYRLRRMTTVRAAETLQDLQYTYDPVANITLIRDDAQQTIYFNNAGVEPHNDFEYDALYRLIRGKGREHIAGDRPPDESDSFRMSLPHKGDMTAIQPYDQRYEYDAVGNMLNMIHAAGLGAMANRWTRKFTYNTEHPNPALRNNQLTSTAVGATTLNYTYDAHGNMENLPHLSGMSWDFENQLESIDKGGGGKVYYNYDADGNRVRKVWEKPGGITEERLYVGAVEIYTRTQGGAVKLRRETLHVMDDKRRIAIVDTRTDVFEQLIRYQYGNHLGTASLELDDGADIISYEEYYPFGSTSYQAGRSVTEVQQKRYRYTTKERDEESGLYYHGARYYAPWLARWISPDPVGIEDGVNVYAYVRNNPVNTHDPTGLWSWKTVAIVAAVVVVGVAVTVATAGAAGPIVAGAVASVGITGTAATVTTAVVVGAAAGAAGGAASELTRQVGSGERVNARAIGVAALSGAAGGAVTGGLGAAATAARTAGTVARTASTAARATTTAARATRVASTVARGAGSGAAGGAATELGRQVASGEGVSARGVLRAAATGAVLGGGTALAGTAIVGVRNAVRAGGGGARAGAVPTARPTSPTTGAPPGRNLRTERDIVRAIEENADEAVRRARVDVSRGTVSPGPQAFGTRAHGHFEDLNIGLRAEVRQQGSTFALAVEEFRDSAGNIVGRRAAGSIGADVTLLNRTTGNVRVFDLKTFANTPTPISNARQNQFLSRFGARAEEIFRRQ